MLIKRTSERVVRSWGSGIPSVLNLDLLLGARHRGAEQGKLLAMELAVLWGSGQLPAYDPAEGTAVDGVF